MHGICSHACSMPQCGSSRGGRLPTWQANEAPELVPAGQRRAVWDSTHAMLSQPLGHVLQVCLQPERDGSLVCLPRLEMAGPYLLKILNQERISGNKVEPVAERVLSHPVVFPLCAPLHKVRLDIGSNAPERHFERRVHRRRERAAQKKSTLPLPLPLPASIVFDACACDACHKAAL